MAFRPYEFVYAPFFYKLFIDKKTCLKLFFYFWLIINKFDDKEDKSLFITESNENLTKLNNNNNDDEEEFVRKLIFSLEFYFR